MALILATSAADLKVWRTVKVQVPKDGNDKSFTEMTFKAQFQLMGVEEFKDLMDADAGDALHQVFIDATGIKADIDSKEDEEFTSELKSQLIDVPWIRSALLKSYMSIPGGKQGN